MEQHHGGLDVWRAGPHCIREQPGSDSLVKGSAHAYVTSDSLHQWLVLFTETQTREQFKTVSILPGLNDPDQEGANSCSEVFLKVPLHKQAENDSLLNLKGLDQQSKNLEQKKAFSQLHVIH